jgi:hypothetical protein
VPNRGRDADAVWENRLELTVWDDDSGARLNHLRDDTDGRVMALEVFPPADGQQVRLVAVQDRERTRKVKIYDPAADSVSELLRLDRLDGSQGVFTLSTPESASASAAPHHLRVILGGGEGKDDHHAKVGRAAKVCN